MSPLLPHAEAISSSTSSICLSRDCDVLHLKHGAPHVQIPMDSDVILILIAAVTEYIRRSIDSELLLKTWCKAQKFS